MKESKSFDQGALHGQVFWANAAWPTERPKQAAQTVVVRVATAAVSECRFSSPLNVAVLRKT